MVKPPLLYLDAVQSRGRRACHHKAAGAAGLCSRQRAHGDCRRHVWTAWHAASALAVDVITATARTAAGSLPCGRSNRCDTQGAFCLGSVGTAAAQRRGACRDGTVCPNAIDERVENVHKASEGDARLRQRGNGKREEAMRHVTSLSYPGDALGVLSRARDGSGLPNVLMISHVCGQCTHHATLVAQLKRKLLHVPVKIKLLREQHRSQHHAQLWHT
eukprot:scaffold6016_cov119-Isochrysis_galbana.AAC.14